jgi:FlgD Ig-like domain
VSLTDPTQQSVMMTENAAGGDILDAEIVSDTRGYAIVATPSFTTELIAFDPSTGTKIGSSLYAPGGYDLNDIEPDDLDGVLLLTDRHPTNPGIRRFDLATGAQIAGGPIDVGLPPFDILVEVGVPTGAGATPAAGTTLGQNYPNPFNPTTSIPYTLARAGRAQLRILDVTGRVVAALVDGAQGAGAHVARWDGRDERGFGAASGVYFAQLRANGTTSTRKVVLLK